MSCVIGMVGGGGGGGAGVETAVLPFPDKPNSALTQLSVDLRNVAMGEGFFFML